MKKLLILLAFLPIAFVSSFGQGARFESVATTVTPPVTPGGFPTVLAIPGATVVLCNNNSSPCNSKVQTYTDITLGTPCSTSAQMTMPGSSTCTATTDVAGNIGFWFSPPTAGTLYYTETVGSATYGPYSFTVGASSSMINTWANLQKFYIGTPSQANWPGTATVAPTQIDIESGSASTPTTGQYLSNPSLFISRYDATTIAACESGLLNLCAAPVARIAYSNTSTTTMSSAYGLILEGSRFAANTKGTNLGHNYTHGIGVALGDAATPNIAAMTGADLNITVTGLPAQCHFGAAGGGNTNCARLAESSESNVTNSSGTDAVVNASAIGNYIVGHSIQHSGLKDSSFAIVTGTGTAGHGFAGGISFGGLSGPVGVTLAETGISNKPDVGMLIGTQGHFGYYCGAGSLTALSPTFVPAANWTLSNPSTACFFLDVLRTYNTTGAAQSNILQWRSATGASTYQNFRSYLDTANILHIQSDASGSFADVMQVTGAVLATNQNISVTGNVIASNTVILKSSGGNSVTLTSVPTGGNNQWSFKDLAGGSDVVPGLGTTNAFTGANSFTSAALTTPTIGGETISKAPRMTFTCQIASLNGVASYCAFITEQPITVTRLVIQQITGSTGCATFPVVAAFNATGSANITTVTESAATLIDGGAVSVNVAAAQTVVVRVTTAGVTCSPTAANVNVTIQYKMQ